MNLKKIKNELIEYGRLAGVKNFTPGYSGNFSARYGDKIVITSSGSARCQKTIFRKNVACRIL